MKRNFTYIDNSNLFVEGCRIAAVRKHLPGAWTIVEAMSNRVVDVTWRLDYDRLRDFVSDTEVGGKLVLWGSTNDSLSAVIERAGIQVINCPRNLQGKEKRVDVAIAHAITKDAYSGRIRRGEDEITLVTGDSDFVPVVDDLVAAGYIVHVVFWEHAARDLKYAASRFICLDPFHSLLSARNLGLVSSQTNKSMH